MQLRFSLLLLVLLPLAGVTSAHAQTAKTTAIISGEPATGTLDATDNVFGDGSYFDLYTYYGTPGETIVITLRSSDFDAYLIGGPTQDEAFAVTHEDDDSGGGTDAQLTVTLGASGEYVFLANTYEEGGVGAYVVFADTSQ